jgi:hypothetical protein
MLDREYAVKAYGTSAIEYLLGGRNGAQIARDAMKR